MNLAAAALIRLICPLALALGAALLPAGAMAQAMVQAMAPGIAVQPVALDDGASAAWNDPSCSPSPRWQMAALAQRPEQAQGPVRAQGPGGRVLPSRGAGHEGIWPIEQAFALLRSIERIGAEGLNPADYQPAALRAALADGAGPALDALAGRLMLRLVAHVRDGRTPVAARGEWFAADPASPRLDSEALIARALATGSVAATLAGLHPIHPDYAALREELARTPAHDERRRQIIAINMDRWRWLPRELGALHLLANVPQFQMQVVANGAIVSRHRTIVGAPGRRSTPQLSEIVSGVILNPNWTAPQSIVVGQGLGARVLNNPAWARREGFTARRSPGGMLTVVQAPGPRNALGAMKLDMPNPHAIFFHDTPGKHLFANEDRALSNGCIRVERALELAMLVLRLGEAGISQEEATALLESGRRTSVPLARPIPAYITYFTLARDEQGNLREFADLYGRDGAVLAALSRAAAPEGR